MSVSTNNVSLFESLRNLFKLYVADAKLSMAQKLSHALAATAILLRINGGGWDICSFDRSDSDVPSYSCR